MVFAPNQMTLQAAMVSRSPSDALLIFILVSVRLVASRHKSRFVLAFFRDVVDLGSYPAR